MSGPSDHPNEVTVILPDGRWHHRFRQSFLGSFTNCPEAARRAAAGLFERRETDATAVGTAVHAAIEQTVELGIEHVWLGADDVVELFHHHWGEIQVTQDIQWVKRKIKGATNFGVKCIETWAEHIQPTLEPLATEVSFRDLVIHEDDQRLVTISGTMDYVDRHYLGDWKTKSREFTKWEEERWAIQPTVYWWAIRHDPELAWIADQVPDGAWKFIAMVDDNDPKPQIIDVDRPPEWDHWLHRKVMSLVPLMEAGLDVWPMNDTQALCSPKWCESWDPCKGAHIVSPVWVTKHKKEMGIE